MFEKFGEFDSAEELNRAAAAQKEQGDDEAVIALAIENGLDKEDAEDYIEGCVDELATPAMAAVGKLNMEDKELKLEGVLMDWKEELQRMCMDDQELCAAVRKKGKSLCNCLAGMLRFAFENKVQVSEAVVKVTKVTHNGKEEPMRGPVYLGMPNRKEVRELAEKYYLGR